MSLPTRCVTSHPLLRHFPPTVSSLPTHCVTSHPLRHFPPAVSLPTRCVTSHPLCHFPPAVSLPTRCVTSHPLCHFPPAVSLPTHCVKQTPFFNVPEFNRKQKGYVCAFFESNFEYADINFANIFKSFGYRLKQMNIATLLQSTS